MRMTSPNPAQQLRQNNPTGKIQLKASGKSGISIRPVSPDKRGVAQRQRTRGLDAVDAGDGGDDRLNARTAKSCGPGAPMLASSWRRCSRIAPMTVAKKPGHRGEHEASRKTTAQGKPDASAGPVCSCACFCARCTRDRGCSAHPAFPAPSASRERVANDAKLGHLVPRECGLASSSLFDN